MRRLSFGIIICLLALSATITSAEAGLPTPAGTIITQQAFGEYKNLGGETYETQSNIVTTLVTVVPGVDITDGNYVAAAPGSFVVFHHILTNTANAPEKININVASATGFPYEVFLDTDQDMNLTSADAPFIDTDGDGLIDTDTIEPGVSILMLIKIQIPAQTDLTTVAVFGITVSSSLDSSVVDYAENSISVDEARPVINVTGSPAFAYLGTEYEFKVSYANNGDIPFANAKIMTPLPMNLEFVSASSTYVYDQATRTITWDLGDIAPNGTGSFTVRVKVVAAGPGITYVNNEAALTGDFGVNLKDFETTGLVTTAPASITLIAVPDEILGDGISQSLLTATVLDALGNPVPDGTQVSFGTEMGTFLINGLNAYTGTTTDGLATVILVAPLMHGFEPISALVEAKAGTQETGEAYDTITITFKPAGVLGIVWSSEIEGPVQGILAELLDESGQLVNSVRTDADGRYMLIAPSVGKYTVRVHTNEADGRGVTEMPVDVQQVQGAIWSTPGAILGSVVADLAEGAQISSTEPVSGVNVDLFKDGLQVAQTFTDEFGEFMFLDLPLGNYVVRASTPEGLIGYSQEILEYNGEVLISAFVVLYESGKVYDASSLAAIQGAEVTLQYAAGPLAGAPVSLPATPSLLMQPNPAYTDGIGHYVFFADAGQYVLKSTAFGYLDFLSAPFTHGGGAINSWIPMQLVGSEAFEIVKEASRSAAAPGETVKFTLTWSNTSGSPISGVKLVDLLPTELSVIEDTISGNGAYDSTGRTITWDYADIDASQEPYEATFYATVADGLADGTELLNRAEVSALSGERATASVAVLVARKPGIEMTKQAGSASASTGDIVTYKITITNASDSATPMDAYDIEVEDTLPAGFSYMPGSTFIDGASASDPAVSGGTLVWQLGDMLIGESHEIVYKSGVGAGAAIGSDSVNYAMASGLGAFNYPFEVGPASASVLVTGPAFSSLGSIIGKVFEDRDGDAFQDKGEPGVAGAEILMDDGMRVITDKDGLYHIGQVKPGVRSIKLNLASLPFAAQVTDILKDNVVGASSSYFVDVYPSGVVRADFPVKSSGENKAGALGITIEAPGYSPVKEGGSSIQVRIKLVNEGATKITGAFASLAAASSDQAALVQVAGGGAVELPELLPGQGGEAAFTVSVSGLMEEYSSLLLGAAAYMPGEGTAASVIFDRESAVTVLYTGETKAPEAGFAITSPERVSLASLGHITIKTVSPLAVGTKLVVNGTEVPKDKVGTTTRDGIQGKLFLEYVSVEIAGGENLIELINEKTGKPVDSVRVLMAGQPSDTLMIRIPTADGLNMGSRLAAAALVVDGMGLPAGRYVIPTFMAKGADFVGDDLKPQDEGFQPKGGDLGNYDLLLSVMGTEGRIELTGEIGDDISAADLTGLANKTKPALVVGTIELTHNLSDFSGSYIRARAFLRKEFAGGVLTLRYDSEQGYSDGLYSDASDDVMYSLYGDASAVQNASPAASPFYAKLSAGGIYAMWGDFMPLYQGAELSSFKSKFTGLSAGASFGGFTLGAFAAPVKDGIRTDRIEADGTSGYFFLANYPLLQGSESVYVVLTSADDQGIVLERLLLKRASDYAIDYQTGSILLSSPVPSYDEEGNRYFIETTYTTPGTNMTGLVAGGRVHADLGAVDMGLTGALTSDFSEAGAVIGADFGLDLGNPFRFSSEAAVSIAGGAYGGYAVKAGASSKIGKIGLGVEFNATDGGFIKPGEETPLSRQIALVGKAAIDKDQPLILSLTSSNYWKGAALDFSSENKLIAGYRLPFSFDMSLGLVTTFAYDGAADTKGAIFDAFLESSPIPQLTLTAYAQIAKVGVINDKDGDYSLALAYKPTGKVSLGLSYITGLKGTGRYHTLGVTADVAVTKNGKVYGKVNVPFGSASAKVLSLGYKDAYVLMQGLKANFLLEGAAGFTNAGLDLDSTSVSASGSLEYTAKGGFRANLKQEVSYAAAKGFKSLTKLSLSGKPTDWLTIEGTAAGYYGNSPSRDGLPLTAEAALSLAARPDNTIYTGLLKVDARYFQGEHLGVDEAAFVTTAVTDWTLEAGRYLSVSAKAGYKMAAEGPIGETLSFNNLLLAQGGLSLHITRTTDVEGFIRAIGWADAWKLGYSVQVVQELFSMVSVAAGYNSRDLSEADIVDQKPWTEGFYLKMLVKF